jgi:uncharacterized membrane protein
MVVAFAFGIGIMAGLRSLTPPAVVAWAAYLGWLDLHNSYLAFMSSAPARYLLLAVAVGELIADKLPSTPNRTAPLGLGARVVTGAVSGMAIGSASNQVLVAGILGALGAIAGAFAGYEVRHRLVGKLQIPDLLVALFEDAVAIAGSVLLVSRI